MKYAEIIAKGKALGLTDLEIYLQTSNGMNMRLFEGTLDTYNEKSYFGIAIRGLFEDKMGFAYAETLDNIDELLEKVIQNAKNLNSSEKEIIYDGSGTYQSVKEEVADFQKYSNQDKIQMLQKLEKSILDSDERIKKVSYCNYQENAVVTQIINSKGVNLTRNLSYSTVFAGAVAEENGETAVGFSDDIGYEFENLELERIRKEVVEDATGTLGAGTIETGTYPVVFRRSVATELLQAFSGLFSGEAAKRNLTLLKGKEGEKVFGDNITIYDDPFVENAIVKIPFDDEGVPCFTKTLVENGAFKMFLHNLATADFFKTSSTGNGFKNSVASSVRVGPTNLYLKPGEKSFDDLIKSLDSGIYVTEINGLHSGANPISGAFNVQGTGYYVKDGKIDRPITLFVISGNFLEMLNEVELIANDLEKRFIGVASPAIKVRRLKISGK
ncbi:MAG: TldD/PmbA family protein [Bacilli bacterium]|jgi:PmbA protein|nr:TldD/PmbA family protein [Bacilli bacterium]HHU24580.1 TldD/PmbA family protein [Acholeplasmataceae bacterium]